MKNYLSKQKNINDSQYCYNLVKTHRTRLKIEVNSKDGPIQYQAFFQLSKSFFTTNCFNLFLK